MKVSVVTPSFNQVKFLTKNIDSVFHQVHENYEHIIFDGLSTDGSQDTLKAYSRKNSKARVTIESDRGQVDAINKGLSLSTGEILTWINSDDYYYDEFALTKVVAFFEENSDADIVYGRGLRVDANGDEISEAYIHQRSNDFTQSLQHSIGILQPALFFRRRVFEKVGGLDENYNLQLDYELWIRMAQSGFKFSFIDELICKATVHAAAKSTQLRQQQLNECLSLVYERFSYVPIDWIQRYADFYLTEKDCKVDKSIQLSSEQESEKKFITRYLLEYYNTLPEAFNVILRSETPSHVRTLESMSENSITGYKRRKVVITSFDSPYLQQGLNLIASLHRTSFGTIDAIYVYSLGLSKLERERLNDLEKVEVIDYPKSENLSFPEYLHPKTRAYKPYAIRSTSPYVNPGDLVLWMDSGLSVMQDIEQIFRLIEYSDFFITDHNDSPHWPFYNVSFTHKACRKALQMTNDELIATHLCSAIVGYRVEGKFQKIIDEAYELGSIRETVLWPKVLPKSERYVPSLNKEEDELRKKLVSGAVSADSIEQQYLLSLFPYYGHRTQSIYSVLVRRYKAPIFPGTIYRRANQKSSKAASINWGKSAQETDLTASRSQLSNVMPETIVYHHRGTYHNLDGLKFSIRSQKLFVLGNGPSLKGFEFDELCDYDSLGMNAAYRFWDISGFYPTYYTCFDTVVLKSHSQEIRRLIRDRHQNGIKKFFLRDCILEDYPELERDPSVYFLERLQESTSILPQDKITTGSFSVRVGIMLGYREIYLLGIDLNYVEKLTEAKVDGRALEIAENPIKNPNYFFDGYQLKGDRYNPPNRHPDMHLRSWSDLKESLQDFPCKIINLNSASAVRCFEFQEFRAVRKWSKNEFNAVERYVDCAIREKREQTFWRNVLLREISEAQTSASLGTSTQTANENTKKHDKDNLGEETIKFSKILHGNQFANLSENRWRYMQSDLASNENTHKTRSDIWMAAYEINISTVNRGFVGIFRLQSQHELTLTASIERTLESPYESAKKQVLLRPNIEKIIQIKRTFKESHNALKIQLEVKKLDGVNATEIQIDPIGIFETPDSIRGRIKGGEISFSQGNQLLREGDYTTALSIYLSLYMRYKFDMYYINALMAAQKLGIKAPNSLVEIVGSSFVKPMQE